MRGHRTEPRETTQQPPKWRYDDEGGLVPACPLCNEQATEEVHQPWADYPMTYFRCPKGHWEYVHF